MKFNAALTDCNTRQFKTWMKKMAVQVNFGCFLMFLFSVWVAIWCLKIGTFVLIKVLLTYLPVILILMHTVFELFKNAICELMFIFLWSLIGWKCSPLGSLTTFFSELVSRIKNCTWLHNWPHYIWDRSNLTSVPRSFNAQ